MKLRTKQEILNELKEFDVKHYEKSRNYIDGGVSKLSPYITHGVLSTYECVELIVEKYSIKQAEKFLMELVWKEFFMKVQKSYGNPLTQEAIRDEKTGIEKKSLLPSSFAAGNTRTGWVDDVIREMNTTGRLHNHKRMRLASRCCHWAKLDWKKCADWTYYHFIDGELSANHLSRQRVNSTFANKAYFMNQDNLQKYRPGVTAEDLAGSYDQVAERIFNPDRPSIFWKEDDISGTLVTPRKGLAKRDASLLGRENTVRILSPWKLDEALLSDEIPTIVVLDNEFTKTHPRSQNRLDFVKQYTDKHGVDFVRGSYQEIIQSVIDQGTDVILDERWDPMYKEVQRFFSGNDRVEILPYHRINTDHPKEPIMKFFKYWNKTTAFIRKMIND